MGLMNLKLVEIWKIIKLCNQHDQKIGSWELKTPNGIIKCADEFLYPIQL